MAGLANEDGMTIKVGQIAILKIQLVGHIAVRTAYPAVIKPADDELLAICERHSLCRFINAEAKILLDAR
jgi:hypothetical protein